MSARPRRDSPKCAIVNLTVSFNVEDTYQHRLLQYVQNWTNFSGTVKRLIATDMSGYTVQHSATALPAVTREEEIDFIAPTDDYDPVADLF